MGIAHGLSDQTLVEAVKRGHSTAFDTLPSDIGSNSFVLHIGSPEVMRTRKTQWQDTLLRAFVHMRDFDGRSKLGTWLTRIAINSALMIPEETRLA